MAESGRQPYFYAAVGKKGIGKTHNTLKVLRAYCGDPRNPKRGLIFDVNQEYEGIKTLALKDVLRFSAHPRKELRRVVPPFGTNTNGLSSMLQFICDNYRDGMLHVEDVNKFTSEAMPKDLIGSIIALRHLGVDVSMSFQNIGRLATPKIVGNLDMMRIHYTTDSPDVHREKFKDKYTIIQMAYNIVKNDYMRANLVKHELTEREKLNLTGKASGLHGVFVKRDNQYKSMFVYVDCIQGQIKGGFTLQEFKDAVNEFIDNNEKIALKPILNKKNENGGSLYTYKEARALAEFSFISEFYGNKDRGIVLKQMSRGLKKMK